MPFQGIYTNCLISRGMMQRSAILAHNQKVVGSNPTSATSFLGFTFCLQLSVSNYKQMGDLLISTIRCN